MAKSIRSKIKRKHRSEFRRTIGTEAYNANMEKTQTKMKEYLAQQSTNSFDRISEALNGSNPSHSTSSDAASMEVDNNESGDATPITTTKNETIVDSNGSVKSEFRGENKVIVKRKMSRKIKSMLTKMDEKKVHKKQQKQRSKPRFFCEIK